jgi:hypothetical protein
MDNVFNASKKAYRDNFLEYSTTGSPNYKTAYEGAVSSMEKVISELEAQVGSANAEIARQQSSDLKNSVQADYVYQKDVIEKAKMLDVPPDITPMPNMTTQYITVGVLGGILLLVLAI